MCVMTADVTSSADCGSASLAATSEPAGAGSNQTEPTVKEIDRLFSFRGSNASGHTSISSRCTTRFIISSCDGRQKDFRLISLGRIHQSGCFQNSITVGVVSSSALCSFIRAPRRWRQKTRRAKNQNIFLRNAVLCSVFTARRLVISSPTSELSLWGDSSENKET